MVFRQANGVRRDLAVEGATFGCLRARQIVVLLGPDFAEDRAPKQTAHRGSDAAGVVIAAGRDVG